MDLTRVKYNFNTTGNNMKGLQIQHLIGKTIKMIETDEYADTMFIEFTDGHNIHFEVGDDHTGHKVLDITINSFTSSLGD